jgi:hypothetical protein
VLGIKFEGAKANFFDRAKVQGAVDRATVRNLSKFGAFVMTRARQSIRDRRKISEPGQPPSRHVKGTLDLKRSILFAYEPANKSVVIGPALLNGRPTSPTVPELLEHGGDTTITRRKKKLRAHYRPRPFMVPAFETEKRRLPAIWKDSVR